MYSDIRTDKLVDIMTKLKAKMDNLDKQCDAIQNEILLRGIKALQDKNIKSTVLKGSIASVIISKAQKIDITNFNKFKKVLKNDTVKLKIKKTIKVGYDIESDFKKALISIATDDYDSTLTLEELLKKQYPNLNNQEITLLTKKLKGDYEKDKSLLESVIKDDTEDFELELYYIYKIKNYERILKYFTKDEIQSLNKKLKQSISVNETLKVTLRT